MSGRPKAQRALVTRGWQKGQPSAALGPSAPGGALSGLWERSIRSGQVSAPLNTIRTEAFLSLAITLNLTFTVVCSTVCLPGIP